MPGDGRYVMRDVTHKRLVALTHHGEESMTSDTDKACKQVHPFLPTRILIASAQTAERQARKHTSV